MIRSQGSQRCYHFSQGEGRNKAPRDRIMRQADVSSVLLLSFSVPVERTVVAYAYAPITQCSEMYLVYVFVLSFFFVDLSSDIPMDAAIKDAFARRSEILH